MILTMIQCHAVTDPPTPHRLQVRSKDYAKAEASYSNTLGVMEQMLAKLPPDQAEKMRKQLDSIKGKMTHELGAAAKVTK